MNNEEYERLNNIYHFQSIPRGARDLQVGTTYLFVETAVSNYLGRSGRRKYIGTYLRREDGTDIIIRLEEYLNNPVIKLRNWNIRQGRAVYYNEGDEAQIQVYENEIFRLHDLIKIIPNYVRPARPAPRARAQRAQSQTTTVLTDDNISDMLIRYIRRFQDYIPLPSDLSDVPIGDWDVSEVTDMSNLFYGLETFNEPLNDWNVSNVTNMESMFEGATSFNQPLDRWDVSNVRNMRNMFKNTSLSQDPNWNISPNVNTRNMFQGTPLARQRRGRAQRAPAAAAQPPPPPAEAPAPRARQTRRAAPAVRPPPPPPAAEPGGVAFEIHNAFDSFKLNDFMAIIESKSYFINRDRPLQPLIDNINANPANSAEVKRDLTAKITRIFTTLREYGGYETNKDKIIKCIQYVLLQPQEFIDIYIQTLITDCLKAYSSGRQESCVKGVYERIFYSFRDTIATICLDQMQGTGPAPLCKPEYITLFEYFYETWPKEGPGGLNEYTQEWYGDGEAVSALSPENRIESFVDFVRRKINNAARFRQAEASIRRYANEDLQNMGLFGGKRRKKRSVKRTKRNKKTIKKRR